MIFAFLIFILIGALAGLLAGLIGIGGGVVVVPSLYYTLATLKIPPAEIMQIVIGTSLATIAFNTFISSLGHYRKKSILLRPLKRMLPGLILGAMAGATIAKIVPGDNLKIIFAIFEILIGLYFIFFSPEQLADDNTLPKGFVMTLIGMGISCLSTLLGISGGVITVPTLLWFKVPMKKAVGTSATTSFIIALVGTISFLIYGIGKSTAHMTLGFIYLPAFLAICGGSLFAAPLAVELSHKLPTQVIKKIFAGVLIIVGLLMLMK